MAARRVGGVPAAAVGLLCTLVPLAVVSGLAGCAHSVGPTPPLAPTGTANGSPTAGSGAASQAPGQASSRSSGTGQDADAVQSQRPITLPVTIGISFQHPASVNQTEQQILYTVQQAMSSLLHAEYGPGAADPLLAEYWSDGALNRARAKAASWVTAYRQPVGVVALTHTNYTAPAAEPNVNGSTATVSLCEGWQDVSEGNALTHVVEQPVQAPGTPGTFTVLTLTQSNGGFWTVSQDTQTARSLRCPPGK